MTMRTTVTKRNRAAVPAAIRKRYGIETGDSLEWIDDGQVIKVSPIPADPVGALRGCARGERLVERLLETRREGRERERG